MQNTYYWKSYL